MPAEDNFFTNELCQYYRDRGKTLSQNIIEVLNKPSYELTEDEVLTYKNIILPTRSMIQKALEERLDEPGQSIEIWQVKLREFSESIIGGIVAQLMAGKVAALAYKEQKKLEEPVVSEPSQGVIICRFCGKTLVKEAQYCKYCGKIVREQVQAVPTAYPPAIYPAVRTRNRKKLALAISVPAVLLVIVIIVVAVGLSRNNNIGSNSYQEVSNPYQKVSGVYEHKAGYTFILNSDGSWEWLDEYGNVSFYGNYEVAGDEVQIFLHNGDEFRKLVLTDFGLKDGADTYIKQ